MSVNKKIKHLSHAAIAVALFGPGCQSEPVQAPAADAAAQLRTVRQGLTPAQDTQIWSTPTTASPVGANGGPTNTCELDIVREQVFTTTPPDMTGSGVSLDSMDPTRDGLFAQSILFRAGPFINQTDPDCVGTITLPPGLTLIGIAESNGEVTATDSTWGVPGIDYTSSSPGMESGEVPVVTNNADGSTTIAFIANLNATPYTDTFRILVDWGAAFSETAFDVNLTSGSDINIGGTDGGGRTTASVPLVVAECGDGIVSTGEQCDDSNTTPGDGCDATCQTEGTHSCPVAGGACLTVDITSPTAGADTASPAVISGTASPNTTFTVEITDGGGNVVATQSVTSDGAGAWSFSEALTDGSYTASTSVTTTGGTISDSTTFTVDATAPALTLDAPADNALLAASDVTVSGTAEPGASVLVSLDGGAAQTVTADMSGAWTLTFNGVSDGAHAVSVVAEDAVGNQSAPETAGFTVDTTAPALTVDAPVNNSTINDNTPTISGTAEPGATVTISDPFGGPGFTVTADMGGAWSFTAPISFPDGTYTVSVTAQDAAGNTSAPVSVTATIDTVAPAVTLTTPADGSTVASDAPAISGTAEPGATVSVTLDGGMSVTVTADMSGAWSIMSSGLAEGAHAVSVTATDAAGNTSAPVTGSFTVDTTAPAVTLAAPADGALINTGAPVISGTAEPGATVSVTLDGGMPVTVVADMGGAWSIMASGLPDGGHTISVTATDGAGNTSAPITGAFTVDTMAPAVAITAPANNTTTTMTDATVTGTAEPGATVSVAINGGMAQTVTADGSGDWSIMLSGLAEGANAISATATDAAGNTSAPTTTTVTVDTTAPTVTVNSPTNGGATNQLRPTITGTSEPGATITLTLDGGMAVTITADMSGAWSFTPSADLAQGMHSFTVTATDAVGNTSQATTVNFTIDQTAPTILITTPANGTTTNDATPTISGVADPNATVSVVINGSAPVTVTADMNGDWSFTPAADLADGMTTVTVTATDGAGNMSSPDTRTFTIDTTAPIVTVTAPSAGATTNDTTPTITGTSEPGSTVSVVINGGMAVTVTADMSGDWTFTPTTPLSDGMVSVDVTATDAAGNTSQPTTSNFTIDTTAPPLSVSSPADGASTNDATPDITGTSEPGATISIVIDGGAPVTVTADMNGDWSFTPTTDLMDGSHTVEVTATDNGGASTTQTVTFDVDTVDPALTLDTPAPGDEVADTTPTITGTAEAGQLVEIFVDGMKAGEATADMNGDWSFTPGMPLITGDHTVRVDAADEAGNTSSTSVDFKVVEPTGVMIASPAPGDTVTDTTPTITGTAAPGATVEIFVDGAKVGEATADMSGDWTFDVPDGSALGDGDHTISAKVGESEAGPITITVDAGGMAPILTVTTPATGDETNDPTPTISGTSDPGATVEIFVDGTKIGEATADMSGSWTFDVPEGGQLSDGEHTISATATTDGGATTLPEPITITVDTTAPATTITTPTDGGTLEQPATVTGTGEPGSTVTVTIDGETVETTVGEDGSWSVTIPDAVNTDGEHTISVTGEDSAGNVSEVTTITATITGAGDGTGDGSGSKQMLTGGCACASVDATPAPNTPVAPELGLGLLAGLIGWVRRRTR